MEQKEIWLNILFFLGLFLAIYVLTYCMNLYKLKKKKQKNISELNYLILKFHLDKKKLKVRSMLIWFSIIDAFIISFVTTFITIIKLDTIWQILIGFVLLFVLIYAFYEIYGRHLINKGLQESRGKKYEL